MPVTYPLKIILSGSMKLRYLRRFGVALGPPLNDQNREEAERRKKIRAISSEPHTSSHSQSGGRLLRASGHSQTCAAALH